MAKKQNPNKGNTSREDMLRMAQAVRRLRIPLSEVKSKNETKNKRGESLFFIE